MIIFISDLDLRGSGYMNIAANICQGLQQKGREIKALGWGYEGQEHSFDFSIIPVPHRGAMSHTVTALNNMIKLGLDIDVIITALDIPLQLGLLQALAKVRIPYFGIFPVESGPLTRTWAAGMMSARERFIISKWGTKQADLAGAPSNYIEISLDTDLWRQPTPEERTKIRSSLGLEPGDFCILTVADNHERKNLAAAAQAISKARKEVTTFWALVSRIQFRAGWNLNDLTMEYDIADTFMPYERGMAFHRLWSLYAAADAFLLTSKAEGLCMPILEAMSVGVPVIATDCTAITEHLEDGRGLLIPSEYQEQGVWGNSWRHFIDTDLAAEAIIKLVNMSDDDRQEMIAKARQYVVDRPFGAAADLLDRYIQKYEDQKRDHVREQIKEAAKVAVL